MHNPKEQKKMPHARENFRYIPFLFQKFREARNLLEPESLGCNLWGTEVKAKYDDHLQATLSDKNKIYSGAIGASTARKHANLYK